MDYLFTTIACTTDVTLLRTTYTSGAAVFLYALNYLVIRVCVFRCLFYHVCSLALEHGLPQSDDYRYQWMI